MVDPSTASEEPSSPSAEGRRGRPSDGRAFGEQMRVARSEFEHQVAQARADFEEANERIKARTGRDLILAVLIGIAIGAVVLLSLVFASWPFFVFALAVAVLGVFELARALQGAGRRVDLIPQLLGAAAVVCTAYGRDGWLHWVTLFVVVILCIVWRVIGQMASREHRSRGEFFHDALVAALLPLYVPFLAGFAVGLLQQPRGEWWVMSFLIVAIAADTGAYVTGLLFGRHPMAPRISPKKTWEGFAGAAVASILAGVLLAWLMLHLPVWTGIVIGLTILVTATIGDLGESMIKRDLGIKDMSSWLPGHGGVLDRLDSLLPSAAAAVALYVIFEPLALL